MSEQRRWYLVAYDIRDDKRLRRVAKTVEGFGERVQYSLFRCRLTQRDRARMEWELEQIMEDEDDLLVIGICPRCAERIKSRQGDPQWNEEIKSFEIV